MANTQHQAIVEAVAAVYLAATPQPLAGGYVFEGRDLALASDIPNQINVFLNDTSFDGEVSTGAPIDHESQVATVIRARKSADASAEKVADALWFDCWSRLMADQSLGGLVMQLRVDSIQRDRDPSDPDVAAFTWNVTVTHRTSQNTLA